MRCFTDGEIRQGVIAVRLADGAADLFEVFLLAAVTPTGTPALTGKGSADAERRVEPPGRHARA